MKGIVIYLCWSLTLSFPGGAAACWVGESGQPPLIIITEYPPQIECGGGIAGSIRGTVANIDTTDTVVVLYAEAERQFWVQPYTANPVTEIHCDGTFENLTHGGHHYVAVLAQRLWDPPNIVCDLPPVGGEVIAVVRVPAARTIEFAGYTWQVTNSRECLNVDPGPNYWSDTEENVWVDQGGQLHLRITRRIVELEERWYCAEVALTEPLGFGWYRFEVNSRVDNYDPSVVAGLFTYYCDWGCTPSICGHHEIDIEFSSGLAAPYSAQYVVQPYGGCLHHRFDMPDTSASTHEFIWFGDVIEFQSWRGYPPYDQPGHSPIAYLSYNNAVCIPQAMGEVARMNLWLIGGNPPTDGQEAEIIVKDFRFAAITEVSEPSQDEILEGVNLLGPITPNPFNPVANLNFRVPEPGEVSIRVHDARGSLVRILTYEFMEPGRYWIEWDGSDDRGELVPSGVYFFELRIGDHARIVRKGTLLK